MDFYTDIAFAVLLRILQDKKQAEKVRSAILKVFKKTLIFFGTDEDFQREMRRFVVQPEV